MSGLTTQVSITQEPTLCGHDYSQSETVIVVLELEGLSASPRIDVCFTKYSIFKYYQHTVMSILAYSKNYTAPQF